jgi:hypothetical protein
MDIFISCLLWFWVVVSCCCFFVDFQFAIFFRGRDSTTAYTNRYARQAHEQERQKQRGGPELRERVRDAELVLDDDAHGTCEVQQELDHRKQHEHRRQDDAPAFGLSFAAHASAPPRRDQKLSQR